MKSRHTQAFIQILIALSIMFGQGPFLSAQNISLMDHWDEDEMIKMRIESDFTSLLVDKMEDEYVQATIQWREEDGQNFDFNAKVKLRGKFRRSICSFPPLKIKFKKDDLSEAGFKGAYNTFKLVTHCLESKYEANQNVLKEYLSYKMYNEISDNSLRVQLAQITYIDTGDSNRRIVRYGFLIEKKSELASRLIGSKKEDLYNPVPELLSMKEEVTMATFQYMIGNDDYSIDMGRNVFYVEKACGTLTPIAYDFDFSGLVSASYASPNSDFSLPTIKDRIYLGKIYDVEVCHEVAEHFIDKKEVLVKLIRKQKGLSSFNKAEITEYLNTFYSSLSSKPYASVLKPYSTILLLSDED